MIQIYHPYTMWEGFRAGMYEPKKEGRTHRVHEAASLLRDPKRLRVFMEKAAFGWVNEAEQVLSDTSISHRAWLGQSACCIGVGAREDETREAWGLISTAERDAANKVAAAVDSEWRRDRELSGKVQLSLDWGDDL